MDREEKEELVKLAISRTLAKAAEEKVPAGMASQLTRPMMQQAIKKTYVEALKKELANGAVQGAGLRASAAVATKGAARLALIEKVAGPIAGVVVSPLVEVGHVAYEVVVKGEERTSQDFKDAATRGAASGAAGAFATACTTAAIGSVFPVVGTFIGFGVGIFASGYVSKWMRQDF